MSLVMRMSQSEKNVRHWTNCNVFFYTFTTLIQVRNNIHSNVIDLFYALQFHPLQCHDCWFMFLEFVKDEETATEAKLKLHLSPVHIISSVARRKKINLLHWRFLFGILCLLAIFVHLFIYLFLLCAFSTSHLKLWSCFYVFNPFLFHRKILTPSPPPLPNRDLITLYFI